MVIQLKANHMWILDGETNDVVERFPVALIQQPTYFNDQDHIYNNILIFTVQMPTEPQGELHIFQCVSHDAVAIVDDILQWMKHYGMAANTAGGGGGGSNVNNASAAADKMSQPTNVNVKEAVTVFNQIAAQREKKGASTENIHRLVGEKGAQDLDSRSETSSFAESSPNNININRSQEIQENYSNERYVSILNHCFDDIERFIIRLQHAAAAMRELQIRNHNKKGAKSSGDGLLAIRARGPNEDEFFDILSKFKLAFNLLAKLKGCIHDPNAPELVHFLFTPLAIIIEAARSNEPPVDPSLVGIPHLNADAIDLLKNCCTSKEFDLWQSLGLNWIQPIKSTHRLSSPFQPIFTDGWAPSITEPDLIGLVSNFSESETESEYNQMPMRPPMGVPIAHGNQRNNFPPRGPPHYDDSDEYEESNADHRLAINAMGHGNRLGPTSSSIESLERDSPTGGSLDPEQVEWLSELQARNAKIVRVLFPRTANNNKELTVTRGEILEVLDDSRKWWKARNARGQVAHVPHTIVGEVESSHGMGSASHMRDMGSANDDWMRERKGKKGEFRYF